MDPLELLPPEMWEEIFGCVEEATDWHNLYNASPSFHQVAETERVTALFPLVLPQLTTYLITDDKGLKELLPLRRVSHKWRHDVDSLIQSKLKGINKAVVRNVLKYNFDSLERICSFLEKFDETHPSNHNPFVGSSISLYDGINLPWLLRFMRKFGAHLKGLEVLDRRARDSDLLSRVGKLLQLCPALECLNIVCLQQEQDWIWSGGGEAELELPFLPKLKSINITTDCRIPSWEREGLQNSLLRRCCNPDALTEASVDDVPSELLTFPNLESVSLSGTTVVGLSRLRRNASWPLLNELTMNYSRSGQDLDMRSVFQAVEHFGEALHTLTLNISFQTRRDGDTEPPLTLPGLKHLRMTAPGNSISCIDFLASLSELEELHLEGWTERVYETRKEGQIIKVPFSGTEINMLESNIWEVLPRLRKLVFNGGIQSHPTSGFVRLLHCYSRRRGEGGQQLYFQEGPEIFN